MGLNVKYKDAAPFVGLDPLRRLKDIQTFELRRSRIPNILFRSIIEDMDLMLMQYGPLDEHFTAEATSRFLSPVGVFLFSSPYEKLTLLAYRSSTALFLSLASHSGIYQSQSSKGVSTPRAKSNTALGLLGPSLFLS